MKKTASISRRSFLIILVALCSFAVAAQEHSIPKEKWSKSFFISDEFCAAKGLKPSETNTLLRVWNGNTKGEGLSRVVDIRWYFAKPQEAAQYLTDNIKELSENGDELTTGITIKDAANLRVFRESAGMRKLNEGLGTTIYMYYFLFTVDNCVAKVFVSTEKKISTEQAADFAREAAKRLKAALS
jgi:hypothetical protein